MGMGVCRAVARHVEPSPAAGLWAVLASGLVCFFGGALYGWSALIASLQARFDVTMAQTGLVFSLAIVSFTLAVIVTPLLRFGSTTARAVACFGGLGAVFPVGAAQTSGFGLFLLCFSGGFGAASGGIYITALGIAAATSRPLVATPAMVAAFGLGGVCFGPLWRQLAGAG